MQKSAGYDISSFSLSDMTICGAKLRNLGENDKCMEEVAAHIVRYLYDNFLDKNTSEKQFVLARLFKTHSYADLPEDLKQVVRDKLQRSTVDSNIKSLVLLGTAGDNPQWNKRESSTGHRAIPLPSEDVINSIPMMRNLIKQFGLDVNTVINPDPSIILDMAQKNYNVFFVPEAAGSSYIPAQEEFVIPYRVKSVLGLGGVLPSGNVFTVILFTKSVISRETTELFRTLALSVKIALIRFDDRVFSGK